MFTQQDLMDRLNHLTLQHNLTWRDVKYDADKAINKVNSFLGTVYPKMSDILLSPESTYTFRADGMDYEYFPEEHIHGVIIPYIAMQVLAREEEFTTIYNKFDQDLEEGLFTMFQKEFNRVPLAFRQNPDQGVFFAADSALAGVNYNSVTQLPTYKFSVKYHINNDNIALSSGMRFVEDTRAYGYEDTYTIKGWNAELLSVDGTKAYKFLRWAKNPNEVTEVGLEVGTAHTVLTDVNLYAIWEEVDVLDITIDGIVTIKDVYKQSLANLIIPDMVKGVIVRTIPTDFLKHSTDGTKNADNLSSIVLPNYITAINARAFSGFAGNSIIIPETPIGMTYPGISIGTNAFMHTHKLKDIIIPTNVHTIELHAFPETTDKSMVIYVRALQQNKPDAWNVEWYGPTNEAQNYFVDVVWGHNV